MNYSIDQLIGRFTAIGSGLFDLQIPLMY